MDESSWNPRLRIVLYFMGLIYSFLGVAIVMDIFMSSIESIASKKKKIYSLREDLPAKLDFRIWDDVVANLTLLCVGTSAPEILLAIIEIVGHNFDAGYIGPGSIVGSSAINLLIIAFCNIALGTGEVKKIRGYAVFCFTGIFSVFAFCWVYLILVVFSKGVVELWEAIVTLLFYPFMVFGSYLFNKKVTLSGSWARRLRGDEGEKEIAEATFFKDGVLDKQSLLKFLRELKNYPEITQKEAAILAAAKLVESEPHSMLWYRMGGVRALSSGRPLTERLDGHLDEVLKVMNENITVKGSQSLLKMSSIVDLSLPVVEFAAATVAVTERVGTFPIYIQRSGLLDTTVSVRVQSIDGMAVHGEDYVPVNEIVTFEPRQTTAEVQINIIDEDKYEPTEEFFLRLTPCLDKPAVKIGKLSIMEIKIIHDESGYRVEPAMHYDYHLLNLGKFAKRYGLPRIKAVKGETVHCGHTFKHDAGTNLIIFERKGTVVDEAADVVTVYLERFMGSDGEVSVHWRTIDITAVSGLDYDGGEGIVKFNHGEVRRFIMIRVFNTMTEEKEVRFDIEIFRPTNGAVLGDLKKTSVIITDDDNVLDFIENVMILTAIRMKHLNVERDQWCKQIKEAMMVKGGKREEATNLDYFLHFLSFLWKVLFSLIPPPGLLGGWLQFFVSILLIAVMAALIGDMADIFGCLVGIENSLTALVLVGAGTSLPDLLACWIVMKHSKNADEAIGNINGTCSVNIFLGLGFPWTLAACHHMIKGDYFKVVPGGFAPTLLLYSGCTLVSLILLVFRRNCSMFGYAEIGGPKVGRWVTAGFLIFLYVAFIVLSTLIIQGVIVIDT